MCEACSLPFFFLCVCVCIFDHNINLKDAQHHGKVNPPFLAIRQEVLFSTGSGERMRKVLVLAILEV